MPAAQALLHPWPVPLPANWVELVNEAQSESELAAVRGSPYGSACGPGNYPFRPAAGLSDPCGMFHFWSPHPGGANFVLGDGSVRFLAYSAHPIMPALATRAGGEVVNLSD